MKTEKCIRSNKVLLVLGWRTGAHREDWEDVNLICLLYIKNIEHSLLQILCISPDFQDFFTEDEQEATGNISNLPFVTI
jgi:hypothetical protein